MLRLGVEAARRRASGPVALVAVAVTLVMLGAVPQASAVPERALHGRVVVGKVGTGDGRITSTPDGIDCGSRCTASFVGIDDPENYQPVTLRGTPEPGSVFEGFGECGKNECTIDPVVAGEVYEVLVTFTRVQPSQFALTVGVSGQGRVTSNPAGVDCGPTCSRSFQSATVVKLTATPVPGWTFAGWGGACAGAGECSVTMTAPLSVTATFTPPGTLYTLAVASAGGGVSSDVPGITCGPSCVAAFGAGVPVTLMTSNSPVVWSGACSGSGPCVVPMTRARAVSAAIAEARPTRVPVAVSVTGEGTVTSSPEGIVCRDACGAVLPVGTPVTLRAAAGTGYVFAGWAGSCRGVATACTVPGTAPAAAAATFVRAGTRYPIAVTKAGRGTITSRPAGILCGAKCSSPFSAGQTVALEAEPEKGWRFAGWTGACSGKTRTCTLGMDGPKSLSVTFGRPSDQQPPRVTALPTEGAVAETVRLRYRVSDQGGRTRETATVYAGQRRLGVVRGAAHAVDPTVLYYFISWPHAAAAATRFCIASTDMTGNVSQPSCAPLRIS